MEVSVACTAPFASPAITEVPPVLVTLEGPETEVIPLTCIPLRVITSKEFVPDPEIVIVIVVAFVRAVVTPVTLLPVKAPLPAEVNSKFAGAVRIKVPNVDISLFTPSVITILPNV